MLVHQAPLNTNKSFVQLIMNHDVNGNLNTNLHKDANANLNANPNEDANANLKTNLHENANANLNGNLTEGANANLNAHPWDADAPDAPERRKDLYWRTCDGSTGY
jgi:hypothetical protein